MKFRYHELKIDYQNLYKFKNSSEFYTNNVDLAVNGGRTNGMKELRKFKNEVKVHNTA